MKEIADTGRSVTAFIGSFDRKQFTCVHCGRIDSSTSRQARYCQRIACQAIRRAVNDKGRHNSRTNKLKLTQQTKVGDNTTS